MYILLLLLLALFLFALAAEIVRQRLYRRRGEDVPAPVTARPEGCCGQHEVCEKESLLAAMADGIEYYEDEELDAFRGRPSAGYTDDEADRFSDVFYTMRPDDVPGWLRSLTLRGVELPDQLKDEVLLVVEEQRAASENSQT